MSSEQNDLLDDLFLGCALSAFLQVAFEQGSMPESEATRRRAYDLYEEALRAKNGAIPSPMSAP